jgi:4-amino-4-deoxy-L-arabinose transferase-like glycosyltransferase
MLRPFKTWATVANSMAKQEHQKAANANGDAGARRPWARLDFAALLIIFLVALAARLTNLDRQSLTTDEFHTVLLDPGTPFSEYWAFVRSVNPDHVPLYFWLTFAWAKIFGVDLVTQRLFPVLAGSLVVIPIYAIARRWLGGATAAIAASCYVAFSSTLIWHGQYLRTNSLLLLVAALSLWAFMRAAAGDGPRWWVINWLLNAVLLLLHVVGALLLLAQGVYLLLRGRWRATFLWGCAATLTLLPWFITVSMARVESLGYSPLMGARDFGAMLLGGDFFSFDVDIERGWAGPYAALFRNGAARPVGLAADAVRMLGLLVTILLVAWAAVSARSGFNARLLVFLLALLPITFLQVVSMIWVPVAQTSHSIVAYLGLALLFGAGVAQLRAPALRGLVAFAVLAPLGALAWLTSQSSVRPDNISAAEAIRERLTLPQSQVIVVDCCWVPDALLPLLLANELDVPPLAIGDAYTAPTPAARHSLRVAHTLQAVLDLIAGSYGAFPVSPQFAVVASTGTVQGRAEEFSHALRRMGLHTEHLSFTDIELWHCRRPQVSDTSTPVRISPAFDYTPCLAQSGYRSDSSEDTRLVALALIRGVDGFAFELLFP